MMQVFEGKHSSSFSVMQVIKDVFAFGREPEWCSPGKHLRIVLGVRLEKGNPHAKNKISTALRNFLIPSFVVSREHGSTSCDLAG